MLGKSSYVFGVAAFFCLASAADSPEVMKLKTQLQQAEKTIEKMRLELKAKELDATKSRNDLIKALQELREKDQTIVKLQAQINANDRLADELLAKGKELDRATRDLNRTKFELDKIKDDLKKSTDDQKKLRGELDAVRNPRLVHQMYFYLKKDAPEGAANELIRDAQEMLGKVRGVRGLWIGKPAEKATPEIAVKDFHVGLVVFFDDQDGLARFLDDAKYKEFLEKYSQHLEKTPVYDLSTEKGK